MDIAKVNEHKSGDEGESNLFDQWSLRIEQVPLRVIDSCKSPLIDVRSTHKPFLKV